MANNKNNSNSLYMDPITAQTLLYIQNQTQSDTPGTSSSTSAAQPDKVTVLETEEDTRGNPLDLSASKPFEALMGKLRQTQLENKVADYEYSSADFTDPYLKSYFDDQARTNRESYMQEPVDPDAFVSQLQDFSDIYESTKSSFEDRFYDGYRENYMDDSASYQELLDHTNKVLGDMGSKLLMDVEKLRSEAGDAWADAAKAEISNTIFSMNAQDQYAKEDAEYWSRFEMLPITVRPSLMRVWKTITGITHFLS